jgi:hypothetical protein
MPVGESVQFCSDALQVLRPRRIAAACSPARQVVGSGAVPPAAHDERARRRNRRPRLPGTAGRRSAPRRTTPFDTWRRRRCRPRSQAMVNSRRLAHQLRSLTAGALTLAILSPNRAVASRSGSSARWGVVVGFVCPSSLPTISRLNPLETRCDAKVFLLSWRR